MTRKQRKAQDLAVEMTSERIDREDAIEALYEDNPSLRALHKRGQIDQEAYEKARRLREAGPTEHPFTALIAALRRTGTAGIEPDGYRRADRDGSGGSSQARDRAEQESDLHHVRPVCRCVGSADRLGTSAQGAVNFGSPPRPGLSGV